jgi:hypothetical protein
LEEQKKKLIKQRILPTALVAVTVPFILVFVVPFEIYSKNRDEFLFSAGDFLPLLLLFALLIGAGMFFAMLFLRPFAYKMFRNVYLMFAFLLFLQGIFLNRGMSAFNTNGARGNTAYLIFNTWFWVVMLGFAVGITFYDDKREISKSVCMILSAVILVTQSVSFASTAVTTKGVFASKTELDDSDVPLMVLTDSDLTTLSANRNVLYFCIDLFDERFADYAQTAFSDVFENLDGFTRFTDHMSLYGHTYPSVAYMVTGNEYDADKTRGEFLGDVYKTDKTLSVLAEKGYKTNVYTQQYYVYTTQSAFPEYVTNSVKISDVKVRHPLNIGVHLAHMALYRCAPMALKSVLGVLNANQCNRNVQYTGDNGRKEYSTVNSRAWKALNDTPFVSTEQNVFKFVHIEGCHAAEKVKKINKSGKKLIKKSIRESFAVVNKYIDHLKKTGAYKDATIVITGDHPAPFYNNGKLGGPKLTALFVKPSGSEGTKLKISSAPVHHSDIWPTIMQSENIAMPAEYGTSVFDVPENAQRERTFYWHTYKYDNTMDVYSYKVMGAGGDFSHWKLEKSTHYDRGIMH